MLMPLPATLRRLVKEYETLLAEETLSGETAPSPGLQDLAYTLCVSTGTREVTQALEVASAYLGTEEIWPEPLAPMENRGPVAELRMPKTSVG
ncbi:DUF5133 domain-containing protein [Streptomyces collinus]|uniref:DUF5133 domain-containing protein n=1 Tax=Streptomyces collinus TaxID=42684 RepID=UPI002942BD74|nr:DUF5133 domain-containing protein [Streptomyces collinus]